MQKLILPFGKPSNADELEVCVHSFQCVTIVTPQSLRLSRVRLDFRETAGRLD
jgi:hypothetical protein